VTERPPLTLHGIRNCDTVKKARAWLDARSLAHRFRDYKAEPPTEAELVAWEAEFGWTKLLNRAGTTFRKLPPDETEGLDAGRAIALMRAHPSAIRRPLLEGPLGRVLGFDAAAWSRLLPG
jgi:Spx/MgsR family transcriptional regulator